MNHRLTSGPCGERDLTLKTKGEGVIKDGEARVLGKGRAFQGSEASLPSHPFLLLMSDHGRCVILR